ncbi:hypothetical protein AYM40_04845 [Paraburkholderia phytofirmans OLGA172]|uniref:Major facilitator superfamily (MFS) profile domain-containing protein n=1 Tax=Paraburkholderia phytofirmans OLGA172 TaxID=1417228 RepID=A0A160FIR5_9BURK|nr:MFS transporter [Paraburkholderia phytofirmans]ANB71776.1 hypothetical protein AYM40_04845 [Paraburkholderia phytofirmans OLGA172]
MERSGARKTPRNQLTNKNLNAEVALDVKGNASKLVVQSFLSEINALLTVRLLTGLGLGAAMPTLIALCTEVASVERRGTAVGAMYCGMPTGAVLATVIGMISPGEHEWRNIFFVGGFGPLLVLVLLAVFMKETSRIKRDEHDTRDKPVSVSQALWKEGRARITLALWTSYLGTLIVIYFLINWLPYMVQARGLTHEQAGVVQVLLTLGAAAGSVVIATLMDRIGSKPTLLGAYVGIALSLAILAGATGSTSMALGGLLAGFFLTGAQAILYAVTGMAYPTHVRGTCVGATVAVGRLAPIIGPLAAGQLLANGQSSSMLLATSIPVIVVAAVCALSVTRCVFSVDGVQTKVLTT